MLNYEEAVEAKEAVKELNWNGIENEDELFQMISSLPLEERIVIASGCITYNPHDGYDFQMPSAWHTMEYNVTKLEDDFIRNGVEYTIWTNFVEGSDHGYCEKTTTTYVYTYERR